eukprot:TRINITY_DN44242_c0_g1_i1.p1 TRINITY_DN44242_c0_g1~~TRINITY_DN44242_c0_g1_i1.p1  ORF type:complete len:245 (-),score=71.29 TRINITY_DN44242_c0_g1_i1:383-1117(-)
MMVVTEQWRCVFALLLLLCRRVHSYTSDSFDYSNASYWEQRYSKQTGNFEWYALKWSVLETPLGGHLRPEQQILHLGTGNSALPEQMHAAGYRSQVATDISKTVIEQMSKLYRQLVPGLKFSVEDALRLSFADESFDVVFEKGTLEALSSDRNCALFEKGCEMMAAEKGMLLEAFRVLKPGGLLVSVADEVREFPEFRERGLERIERIEIKEQEDVPLAKTINLCFKGQKGDGASLPSASRQEM